MVMKNIMNIENSMTLRNRGGHPTQPKVSGQIRRTFVREATKKEELEKSIANLTEAVHRTTIV